MGTYFKSIEGFAAALTRQVIEWRWAVIVGAVVIAILAGSGAARFLGSESGTARIRVVTGYLHQE